MSVTLGEDFKPFFVKNKWFQTVAPIYLNKTAIKYFRKRIFLSDDDFLDLDFCQPEPEQHKIVVLVHGFEGNSNSTYIKKTANYLKKAALDVLAVNLRGCSGEDNRKVYAYHSGKTQDLQEIIEQLPQSYAQIILVGFSLGANLVLKYMSDYKSEIKVTTTIAISAPFDLEASAQKIISQTFIDNRFLKTLKEKIKKKKLKFEKELNYLNIADLKNIIDVDQHYTAPLHGFISASAYYSYAKCEQYLPNINKKTLIINSLDDPLLVHSKNAEMYCKDNEFITLILSKHGGHVGFLDQKLEPYYLKKILNFIN